MEELLLKCLEAIQNYYKVITETAEDGSKVRKVEITPQGYKALEAAGVDIKKMSPDFAEKFFSKYSKRFR